MAIASASAPLAPRLVERVRRSVVAYVQLTKPRIVELLLVTTLPAMVVAQGGWPSFGLAVATLVGGALAAGGANAMNCYLDRDIDEVMHRTRHRPLPEHRVAPSRALAFGVALEVVAFAVLWALVNLVSAVLALSAAAFYVLVYTLWLKRTTVQNIVIGGAAGAVPVLVGWAAVTGTVSAPAWLMFAIVFFWTPPHFWALAIKYRDDYAAASVPMLPTVRGLGETVRQILIYSAILVAASVVLAPVGGLGALYTVSALALGAVFVVFAVDLYRQRTVAAAMRLFSWSITYLAVLFVSMALDRLLR